MDPKYVVPAYQAKRYDGTNAEEIAAFSGYELVQATDNYVRLRVAPDEVTQVNVGFWVLATVTNPPAFVQVVSEWEFPMRFVEHPGPVTSFPSVPAP